MASGLGHDLPEKRDEGASPEPDLSAGETIGGRPDSREPQSVLKELALYPDILSSLQRALREGRPEINLIVTDLDNTLIPGAGRSAAEMERGIEDAHRLVRLLDGQCGILVCVTGSSWNVSTSTTPSVSHRVKTGDIPSFLHAIVTDGGMVALGKGEEGSYQPDSVYAEFLREQTENFPADQIFGVAAFVRRSVNNDSLGPKLGLTPINFDAVERIDPASPRERVFFQPHVHPNGVAEGSKVSLYFYANSVEERDRIEIQFRRELTSYAIVCCEERDFNNARAANGLEESCPMKFCLDITPVHKGTPVAYFVGLVERAAELLQQERSDGASLAIKTWYCGDAANDLVGMRRHEVEKIVMVADSSEELLRHADTLASAGKEVYVELDRSCSGALSIIRALSL